MFPIEKQNVSKQEIIRNRLINLTQNPGLVIWHPPQVCRERCDENGGAGCQVQVVQVFFGSVAFGSVAKPR